jgi:hypothetical protein
VSSRAPRSQSADSFRNSLLAQSRNAARADPVLDPQTRQRLFCFDRLLYRIFSHPGASDGAWALKGAASLLVRLSEARLSKDIDLTTRESLGEAERVLYEAASTDAGDFLRFEIAEESDLRSATGKKFRVVVYCGARRLSAFKMDLSVSANFPNPEELDEAPPFESIDIRGLSRITYPFVEVTSCSRSWRRVVGPGSTDGSAEAIGPLAGVVEHRGRCDDLELFADDTEGHHRPRQRVRIHAQKTAQVVELLDGSPPPDAGHDDLRGSVHRHLHVVSVREVPNSGPDEIGRVAGRKFAWGETSARAVGIRQTVEAEAPPIVTGEVPGDQIPPATEEDQPMWIDVAHGSFVIASGVRELQTLRIAAGLGDRGEDAGVDARRSVLPLGWNGHGRQRVDPAAESDGHHLYDLGERPDRRLLDPDDRASLNPGLQSDADGHRLLVVEDQGRKYRTRGELIAAVDSSLRFHRIAQLAQPVDVASERPVGYSESFRQVGSRPGVAGLQE